MIQSFRNNQTNRIRESLEKLHKLIKKAGIWNIICMILLIIIGIVINSAGIDGVVNKYIVSISLFCIFLLPCSKVFKLLSSIVQFIPYLFINKFNIKKAVANFIGDVLQWNKELKLTTGERIIRGIPIIGAYVKKRDVIIIEKAKEEGLCYIFKSSAWAIGCILFYILIFNFLIKPKILFITTGLSNLQLLIFPFAYSIDTLFNTNLCQVLHLL